MLALALVTRGPLARIPRAGLALYAATLLAVSAGEARPGRVGDAATLPLVFVTMHVPWGLGFLAGSARFGPPLAALARVARGAR